ncbi:MAG: MFS transporter [Vicinamibacteria bacterium]
MDGRPAAFAALRHPRFGTLLACGALAMMADNVEHVVSYWVMFQEFRSPALGGFAVVAHWLPFLLFSIPSGALGDRVGPRRPIQIAMALFACVSLTWAVLFLTHSVKLWHAVVLLVVHGLAGVLWGPLTQLLLHEVVGPQDLLSAVRLTATSRYLGMLLGPAVGSGLLLALGAPYALMLNALIYAPLAIWLWRHTPAPLEARPRASGFRDVVATLGRARLNPAIFALTALGAGAAFFVGNAYQAQMPQYARDFGHGDPGITYTMLLAADAAGALFAGIALETVGLLTPRVRTAILLAAGWGASLAAFALTRSYPLALALLFAAGFLELSFNSMAQALVQLEAPAEWRGRMIGLYSMAAQGMRTFSGVTVGLAGAALGVHWSLAVSGACVVALCGTLLAGAPRRTAAAA